ncbi:MAG: hypothetical protein ABIY51_02875 [Ferruginibacter sp.]
MNRFKKVFPFVIVCIIAISPVKVFAQPDPCTDPDQPCPIDGGLSLLIAAGIAVGAKKAYNKKRKNNTVEL